MSARGPLPNRLRGEITARIDGETRILCLTLGALAELESASDGTGLAGLARRLSETRFSAEDLIRIFGAGLRGGGNVITDAEVSELRIEGGVPEMARIAARLLIATFAPDGEAAPEHAAPAQDRPGPAP
ncbi:gene transfer agent family protein [Pseudohoeflea coraliihabitans]|uniref:Gene transfer agent family protein n=1 Tax=Pseudohoeflea coraliihabitans TaxID=2860393 RepID=A0ABS6WRV4_9HYPH|nr:gene transfer agent family protein [Pseudohoeflea sp. DP4N28-3]MBW3098665.1 gene transfer agent family protein [Pseudohoeflea sp. DP4N28-3]